jgi:exosortase
MRTITIWGSVGLLKIAGVPHYREGFDLHLSNIHLYVDGSCSGIRYLLSYMVFGTAYAFRFKDTVFSRVTTIVSTVPLSILGGILRLSVIFFSAHYISPALAKGRPHVLLSWSVFTILLVGAIAIDQAVAWRQVRGMRTEGRKEISTIKNQRSK